MSEPSNRAKAIFLAALEEHAPEQWPAFLEQACAGDVQLREEVEKLLRARSALGSFHEPPRPEPVVTVDEQPTESTGAAIGPYKLLQQLGEGGMGTVFLAEQTQPVQRKVALKLIKSGMDSRQVIARFEAERQALALMDHPNIARVLDAGTTAGDRPYFVMELVKGVPITQYCDERHLTPQQRLELFLPVCQAVQHAHQKGIIHRDLKPSNVMVCLYDGKPVPKVIDFGVAKAAGPKLTERTLFTEVGSVVGTLEYMSPEQAELNQLDIDTRSDIYSLGVLLYELLTGTTPLERKRFREAAFLEVLRLIREEESPRPSTRLSTTEGLPSIAANRGLEPKKLSGLLRGELDWIVMKALEKDRNRRYDTANGFAIDVERYLADEPVLACPPRVGYKLRKFVRRNRGSVFAVTAVLVALLLGTAVASWQAVEARQAATNEANQRQVAEDEKQTADAARKTAEDQRDRADFLVYTGKLALAQLEFQNNNGSHALALLEQCQQNLRGWEHRHLWTRFNSKQTFLGHTDRVFSVCFRSDGKRLASASADKTVKIWDVEKGQEILTLQGHVEVVVSVCFSPDGKRLASAGGDPDIRHRGELKVWDAETGVEVLALKGHTDHVASVCFSPDGKRLASASADNTVKVWDAETGVEVLTLKGHTRWVHSVCFSPDGKRLASASPDERVKVWDATSGLEVHTHNDHGAVTSVCFSPDSKRLASASRDQTVKVWDVEKDHEVHTLSGHTGLVISVCFSPDGKRLASASWDETVKVWDAKTGLEVHTLKGHTHAVGSVCFSSDGKRLASAGWDKTVKFWDAERGQDVLTLYAAGNAHSVCFSPDGKRLAAASHDLRVQVWDVNMGQEILTLNGHKDCVYSVCFSPDGKRLASASSDGTVKLWDAQNGVEIRSLTGHRAPINSVCFSPDGKRVASAGVWSGPASDMVKVWDTATGQMVLALKGFSVRFSPEGKLLAYVSVDKAQPRIPGTVKLLDIVTGLEAHELKTGLDVDERAAGQGTLVCFSPDGKRLVSAGSNHTLKVWDVQTGVEVLALKGHSKPVSAVCFSPDGKRLASATGLTLGGRFAELKLWDAQTGQEVLDLKGHTRAIVSVCFSPDGKRLASAYYDSTIKIWDTE
jgi:WD40 repeat protein/serine/threonine protein kinase